ncbi:hypothetical protein KIN20_023758 [Parelaphostrongylus tenuis]|uniref:Uncharacterized protein n=1 Tax=Parelaphostrongylus tenuis TaxID=148309 RepID=A0AAD5NAD7_PARTN|nr:hypothetical protein KIN20_023758 [Parelaphostrongylus tenuis]
MAAISAQHPGIASGRDGVQAFISRLVMQTVFDVLENDGRRALLTDAAISSILGQLNVTVIYEPMQCQKVFSTPAAIRGCPLLNAHFKDFRPKHNMYLEKAEQCVIF